MFLHVMKTTYFISLQIPDDFLGRVYIPFDLTGLDDSPDCFSLVCRQLISYLILWDHVYACHTSSC